MKKSILENLRILLLLVILLILFILLDFVNGIWKHIPPPPARLTYIPQFVLISFDGSKSIDLWKDLRAFKEEIKASGKRLNFTHFMNTAYFLTAETRNLYTGPRHSAGYTDIGVSDGIEDIRARINEVNLAVLDGDEIAPHTTGHLSGRGWSKEEWETELISFTTILFGLGILYPEANLPVLNLKPEDIWGFRAPYLDISTGLYEALPTLGYKYDTSEVGIGNDWPSRDGAGLWRIPLGMLYVGPFRVPVLAMDYNLYMHHTQAQDTLRKGTPEWKVAYTEMLEAWREYFNRNYSTGRAPVLMGYHFGKWNDGLYWEVMKEFSREVCGKLEVHCGTFKELIQYMEEYGVPKTQ